MQNNYDGGQAQGGAAGIQAELAGEATKEAVRTDLRDDGHSTDNELDSPPRNALAEEVTLPGRTFVIDDGTGNASNTTIIDTAGVDDTDFIGSDSDAAGADTPSAGGGLSDGATGADAGADAGPGGGIGNPSVG